eukprot:TRINITY_DN5900_c0_g1_i1.p1 TRINITY_DN5900_c0_g1~~TRINITY_DN5900_c0_g1_i1.p1  ORF type:complete len:345 (-),score=46.92 TRINITY_DN5900_c0_g1_i1:114-1079(-)
MSGAEAPSGSSSPIVVRNVGLAGDLAHRSRHDAAQQRLRPSVRQTLDTLVSTGSQADYFKPEQTIILFDWDDTLCPSNWIRENRPTLSFFKPCPPDDRFLKPLKELEVHVEATLKLAMKLGKVVIVTNAMDPWVETSCKNFLPSLMPLVEQLPIIYARSVYEGHTLDSPKAAAAGKNMPGMYTASGQNKLVNHNARMALQNDALLPQRWKEFVFDIEITGFYSRYDHQSWKNVISIGDSVFERDAVRRVVLNRPNPTKKCRTKTAKFLDEPTIEELIAQVKIIHDAMSMMVQYDGNLDIEVDEEDLEVDLGFAEKIIDQKG